VREAGLTAIANLYGTDKGTVGPVDWWPAHNYTDIYEAYLWPTRDQPIRLLEIGLGVQGDAWHTLITQGRNLGGGASVKMWAEYFPKAQIFGIDINPAPYLDTDRITTFVADQGKPLDLQRVTEAAGSEPFDVIIDDGSHRADHQQTSFGALFGHLKTGGLYFIEDLLDNGMGGTDPLFPSSVPLVSTRQVFRTFVETGRFGTPNVIGDGNKLALDIEWVHFHSPQVGTKLELTRNLRRPIRAVNRFVPRSESICVVRHR
jgi:hypothetical protein